MKKVLFNIVLVALILTLGTTVAFAAKTKLTDATEKADILYDMGLFKGTDEGYELDREPTRAEALVMLIRLLGKESAATSCTYKHPFKDVPAWADRYVAYAYMNSLTNGISKTEFGTNNIVNSNMYLTFMLRALGYSDENNKDFAWDNPNDLALKAGILEEKISTTKFYRGDVVVASYNGLNANLKSQNKTLYTKLKEDGAISKNSKGLLIVNVTANNEVISTGEEVACGARATLKISVTPSNLFEGMQYYWKAEDDTSSAKQTVTTATKSITIPSEYKAGTKCYLYVRAEDDDSVYTNWYKFTFKLNKSTTVDEDEEDEDTGLTIKVYSDSTTLSTSSTNYCEPETKLDIKVTPSKEVDFFQYYWKENGSSSKKTVNSYKGTIEVPDDLEDGQDVLYVRAKNDDGDYTEWKKYTINTEDDDKKDETLTIKVTADVGTLSTTKTNKLEVGEDILIKVTPTRDVESLQYYWGGATTTTKKTVTSYSKTIEVPSSFEEDKIYYLYVRAEDTDGVYTSWKKYKVTIVSSTSGTTTDADSTTGLTLTLTQGTNTLLNNKQNEYKTGTELRFTATPKASVGGVEYYWDVYGVDSKTTVKANTTTITIPKDFVLGDLYVLNVRAYTTANKYSQWKSYEFKISETNQTSDGIVDISTILKQGSTTLTTTKTYEYKKGTELTLTGSSTSKTSALEYYWSNKGSDSKTVVNGSSTTIKIPETLDIDETYTLYVRGKDLNGDYTAWSVYTFKIIEDINLAITLKEGSTVLSISSTTTNPLQYDAGTELTLRVSPSEYVTRLQYAWDSTSSTKLTTVSSYISTITIPATFEVGTTHTLYIRAENTKGTFTSWSTYVFKIITPVSSVKLNKTELTLDAGADETLTATILPSTATDKTLTWTSIDPEVAIVNQSGKVTAVAEGTTTIMVITNNNQIARCTVTVNAVVEE